MKDKIELDGKKIFKIALAGLIVFDVPPLIEGMTGKAYSGVTDDLIGAGVGALIGYMAKDNLLVNASIAIAALDIINGFIQPQIETIVSTVKGTPAVLPTGAPQNVVAKIMPAAKTANVGRLKSFVQMPGLGEYVDNSNAGMISSFQTYRDAYRQN